MSDLSEKETQKLQKLRDSKQAIFNRDVIRGNEPAPSIEPGFSLSRVMFHPEDTPLYRLYVDGKRFRVIDRYSPCSARNVGSHVQSGVRSNFCMFCNFALSEY